MSKLSEGLSDIQRAKGGVKPRMDVILAELDDEDRKEVLKALNDRERVTAPALAAILTENGHEVTEHSIGTWRRSHLPKK